jgi:hypothetical protein
MALLDGLESVTLSVFVKHQTHPEQPELRELPLYRNIGRNRPGTPRNPAKIVQEILLIKYLFVYIEQSRSYDCAMKRASHVHRIKLRIF